jgi:hypothetical protein
MAVDWSVYDCVKFGDVASIKCLEPLFANVVSAIVSLIGVGLFLMLIIGGYNYLFAGGDTKKLEKAKGTISGAIIGLIVMVAAYLIIKLIGDFTNTNVETFQIIRLPD